MVATVHRALNTGNIKNMPHVVKAFYSVGVNIVSPVHPRAEKYLRQYGLWDKLCEHVKALYPVDYLDVVKLMSSFKKILADSGGVQKEAYMLVIPCITLSENSEWVETVDDGGNVFGSGGTRKRIRELLRSFYS